MKLTIIPVGWTSIGPSVEQRDENILRYEVHGLSRNPYVSIDATTTAEGKTWSVCRNGKSEGIEYPSAQAALEALEEQSN